MFSYTDIHAHISRLDEEFAEAKRRGEMGRASEIVQRIESDLGTVTVFGTGELKDVELRTYRVTHYPGSEVGRAVRDAIRRAEQRAREGSTS